MVRQHHRLSGHEFEQIPGDSGGQRNLCPWICKEADIAEQLNNNSNNNQKFNPKLFIVVAVSLHSYKGIQVTLLIPYRSQKMGGCNELGEGQCSITDYEQAEGRAEQQEPVTYKVVGVAITNFSQA